MMLNYAKEKKGYVILQFIVPL